MIEHLLELIDSSPRSVIAALLGVILVGSVGGGFGISNLRSSVEAKESLLLRQKSLLQQKEDLEKAKFENRIQSLKQENVILRKQVEVLSRGLETTRDTLGEVRKELLTDSDAPPMQKLTKIIAEVDGNVRELDRTLRSAQDISGFGSYVAGLEPPPIGTTLPARRKARGVPWLALVLFLAIVVVGLGLVFKLLSWIWKRIRG